MFYKIQFCVIARNGATRQSRRVIGLPRRSTSASLLAMIMDICLILNI